MKRRLLEALFAVVLLLLAIAVAALGALGALGGLPSSGKDVELMEFDFKARTAAICEHAEDYVYCHDELIVQCGSDEYVVPKTAGKASCNGFVTEVPLITAFAVFDGDWQDQRLA